MIQLIIMKMEVKMKSRSQGHDIHRPRSRHDTNTVNIEGVSL